MRPLKRRSWLTTLTYNTAPTHHALHQWMHVVRKDAIPFYPGAKWLSTGFSARKCSAPKKPPMKKTHFYPADDNQRLKEPPANKQRRNHAYTRTERKSQVVHPLPGPRC